MNRTHAVILRLYLNGSFDFNRDQKILSRFQSADSDNKMLLVALK